MACATATEYTFTVEGNGTFPVDMLRYDRGRPASEKDAYEIEHTFNVHAPRPRVQRRIKVRSKHLTVDRWSSFGWFVLTDTVEKVPVEA